MHKIARQYVEGFTHLIKTYVRFAKDADLSEAEKLDSVRRLSWFIHRF